MSEQKRRVVVLNPLAQDLVDAAKAAHDSGVRLPELVNVICDRCHMMIAEVLDVGGRLMIQGLTEDEERSRYWHPIKALARRLSGRVRISDSEGNRVQPIPRGPYVINFADELVRQRGNQEFDLFCQTHGHRSMHSQPLLDKVDLGPRPDGTPRVVVAVRYNA